MKKIISASLLVAALASSAFSQISGVTIFDDTVQFRNGVTPITTGIFEVRWGTFSGQTFTPYFGTAAVAENDGYIGDPFGSFEFSATLTAADNSSVTLNSPLALVITLLADNGAYSSSVNEIILTDPSWVAPSFALVGDPAVFSFTANTVAVKGNYSFNGGNEILSIATTAIPEPSTYAAIAGLAVLGAVASRRRRSV